MKTGSLIFGALLAALAGQHKDNSPAARVRAVVMAGMAPRMGWVRANRPAPGWRAVASRRRHRELMRRQRRNARMGHSLIH